LGTARADFHGGNASSLFASGRKLLSFPDHVKIWIGHDYPPEGREAPVTGITVGDHKKHNKHLQDSMNEPDFVDLRMKRDATLAEPKLLHQSLQMNLRAGKLPQQTTAGHRILATPLQLKAAEW
jgi:glyoxylase-like metal-dependent hydrolase (beta-lactamase superfamily II)